MSNTKVAFLGLGQMGRRMAVRLKQAGVPLAVYNRTPHAELAKLYGEAGPRPAAEVIQGAQIIITMLRDDEAIDALWADTELRSALRKSQVIIDCSTQSPAHAQAMQSILGTACAGYFECPVLGTTPSAEAGQLIGLVSGASDLPNEAQVILAHMTAKIIPVGGSGQAARLKVAVNAWYAQQLAALAGLFHSMDESAATASELWSILADSPLTSPAVRAAGNAMLEGQHVPQYPIELVCKDLGYFAQSGQPSELARATQAAFSRALELGWGQANITAVVCRERNQATQIVSSN